MIQHKLKICKRCGHPRKIFSGGLCMTCWKLLNNSPLKRTTLRSRTTKADRQDGKKLSEKETFDKAYNYWQGKFFLFPAFIPQDRTTASNFAHVLRKSAYEYFRYYYKNIVLLTLGQHDLFDNFTEDGLKARQRDYPQEDWDALFKYESEMKAEYELWIKTRPGEYRI